MAAARDVLHELMRGLSGLRVLYDAARALVPSAAETLVLAADRAAASGAVRALASRGAQLFVAACGLI